MDIKSIMSKLQSIESMTRVNEAGEDPAAVIQKYTDMGKKPTPDMPAFIDPKDGKVKWMDKGTGMGQQPQIKVMPTDWIKRYAPDLADALAAQGSNKAAYGSQEKGGLFGIKGLGNFDQGTKVNTAQAGADQTSAKFKADKLKQLNDLIAKLNAETKGGNTDPALGKIDYSLAGGAPGSGIGLKLKESLLREFGMDEDMPALPPGGAPAGSDLVSQLQAVMKELSDVGDDPEVAKALQAAQAAIEANKKAKEAKPAAAAAGGQAGGAAPAAGGQAGGATPAAGGEKGSKPLGPTASTQEKMDRFVYLMNKKKQGATTGAEVAGAQGKTTAAPATIESIDYFANKLRNIELSVLSEALTPEEEKELASISKEVVDTSKTGADIPPDVIAAVKEFETGKTTTPGGGGQAPSPAAGGGDVMALQNALIKAGAKIKADGKMGPATSAAMAQFPDVAKQFPNIQPSAGGGAGGSKNPKLAPITKLLGQIEGLVKKAAAAPAAPAPAPAAAKPGATPKTTDATSPMGAPNNPGGTGKVPPMPDPNRRTGTLAQRDEWYAKYGKTHNQDGTPKAAPTAESYMTDAERYRALVDKLESINAPTKKEKVDEVAPLLVAGGIAAVLASIKGGSDYLDKLAAAKKAVGGLKPEEVKQLADLINQLEELTADEETKKAIDADKAVSKRLADVGNKAKDLAGQAAMASQSTAQTIGGTVGAAIKEPFRMVGRGISSAANAVGDFFTGVGASEE